MGTNAIVAIKQPEGNFGYNIICYDGYFEGAGLDLVKYANCEEAANILVKHDECIDSVICGLTDLSDQTLFCTRIADSVESLIKDAVHQNIRYIYWFEDNHWYGRESQQCSFRLDTLLTKFQNPMEFWDQFISFEKGKLKIDSAVLKSAIINEIDEFDINGTQEDKNRTSEFFVKIADFFENFIKK